MTTYLFIHGWATDRWVWSAPAKRLASGADVINLNLPGHGADSSWNEPTLTPALKEIDANVSALPDSSVVAIGWSLGAEALLYSATSGHKKFRALVLASASPCFVNKDGWRNGRPPAFVKRMLRDVKSDPLATLERFYDLNFTGDELKTGNAGVFLNRYKLPEDRPAFRYDEIATALEAIYRTDLRDRLSGIDAPCLVVHGDKDGVTPVEAGIFLSKNIKGAGLEIFKDAGHAPFLTHEDEFVRRVRRFINGI